MIHVCDDPACGALWRVSLRVCGKCHTGSTRVFGDHPTDAVHPLAFRFPQVRTRTPRPVPAAVDATVDRPGRARRKDDVA